MDKEKWDKLSVDINKLGPPMHTSSEWKRIWSTHKYNKRKRLRSSNNSMDGQPSENSSSQNGNLLC